jgi:glycosyltransferase involved in cell wall biosynthesis
VLARRGPRIEVTGLVDDLRPHLAEAAVAIVPLRVGGGTRLKILEAMAMGKAVVSTTLGAEGIAHRPGENILLADSPADFAAAVGRVLDDPSLAARLGAAGRDLVASTYSWDAAGATLETFLHRLRDGGRPASG